MLASHTRIFPADVHGSRKCNKLTGSLRIIQHYGRITGCLWYDYVSLRMVSGKMSGISLRLCTVLHGWFAAIFRINQINLRTNITDLCFTCYSRLIYGRYTDGHVLLRYIYVKFTVIHGYLAETEAGIAMGTTYF